ncbi:MAG: glutaminyl-peptide cyclotransferase [Arenicellales bacterium]
MIIVSRPERVWAVCRDVRRGFRSFIALVSLAGVYLWPTPSVTAGDRVLDQVSDASVQQYGAKLLARIPHNPSHFTQGLAFGRGALWESTGHYGKSQLIQYPWASGSTKIQPTAQLQLRSDEFGEGLTILGDTVYQLTWKEGKVHRYQIAETTITPLPSWPNDKQGWGLTTDGTYLIASDGSDVLYFHSPVDFSMVKSIPVRLAGASISRLNELEWINGRIWANVWGSDNLVIIDPDTGRVTGVVDCRQLVDDAKRSHAGAGVLNGIAWDVRSEALLLTGKHWPWIYRVSLVEHKNKP